MLYTQKKKKGNLYSSFTRGKKKIHSQKATKSSHTQMPYQQLNHKNPAVCQECFPALHTQVPAVSSHTDPTVLQTWLLQYTGFHIPEEICRCKEKNHNNVILK